MQAPAAAVTMVRDDDFFLDKWVRYYGDMLGPENLYVVNHGRSAEVARRAAGCNVIAIPEGDLTAFDPKRWRLLNSLVAGLRSYFTHVIVGDVDEFILRDPAMEGDLADFLAHTSGRQILTPFGLEVVHRTDREQGSISDAILGPRSYARVARAYSKPCILSRQAKLSRGGHFADHRRLNLPEGLYLFHMKYCDSDLYADTMDRRNALCAASGARRPRDAMIGRHWFAATRDDTGLFDRFRRMEVTESFDFDAERRQMHASWRRRGDKGLWEFDHAPAAPERLHRIPDRFHGVI